MAYMDLKNNFVLSGRSNLFKIRHYTKTYSHIAF